MNNIIPYSMIIVGTVGIILLTFLDGPNNQTISGLLWIAILDIGSIIIVLKTKKKGIPNDNP